MIFNFLGFALIFTAESFAAKVPPPKVSPPKVLVQTLEDVHQKIIESQKKLIQSGNDQKQAQQRVQKIRELLILQKQEIELVQKKTAHLESYIQELESRRNLVSEKISLKQALIHRFLIDLTQSNQRQPKTLPLPSGERLEAPHRHALTKLVDMSIGDLESLRIDLADAEAIENRIQDERQQLVFLSHDLQEQQSLLKFHRELQLETIRSKFSERIAQLQSYQKLKESESNVEGLMKQFNARVEFEKIAEAEKEVSRDMYVGAFQKQKGRLPFPVAGQIISGFGRVFDAQSKLTVFKKGIDIQAKAQTPVKAIFSGKVVYSGKLPGYDNVVIVDHGDHYYSLLGHLGSVKKNIGDLISQGDELGISDGNGQPIYFEVRARNVAVNPLQWVHI